MDAMRYKEGSFMTVWVSLVLANLCLGYATVFLDNDYGVPSAILGLLANSGVIFLTGLWGTLQFTWMQIQYPAVVVAFEKMLLTGCIPVCGGVVFWGVITHHGISGAPYIASSVLCALYFLFGRPIQSSFPTSPHRVGGVHPPGVSMAKRKTIQEPLDGVISFLFVLLVPVTIYITAHHHVIWTWTHVWSIVLLVSGPLLFMSAVPQGLWWLGTGSTACAAQRVLVLTSLAGVLTGIEGRIVFHSFGQYIKLTPPFSYATITLGMYGVAALALLFVSGSLDTQTAGILFGPIAMMSVAMGCLVIGVPIWALPAPLISAGGLAMYTESKSNRDYLLFVLGGLITGVWFLWHYFWFLDVILDGISLKSICVLISLSMLPSLIIPGLLYSKRPGVGILMIFQASVIVYLEELLYSGDFADFAYDSHPMFPASLVIATSILGVMLAKKMREVCYISNFVSFLLQCIYGAKVCMILVPETRLTIPIICYSVSSLYPLFVVPGRKHLSSSGGNRAIHIVALGCLVFLSVAASRFAVFDILRAVLDRKPPESLVGGVLLLAWAFGVFPLTAKHSKESDTPKKMVIILGSFGVLMILLRPPLPIKGGAECPNLPMALCPRLWDSRHSPDHEKDDISLYGDGIRRREHWPLWLVIFASIFGIVAGTSKRKGDQHTFAPKRLAQGSISGVLVGVYMALEFFPGLMIVQGLVIASCLLVSSLVVFMSVPSRGSSLLIPIFGLVWMMCLPLGLFFLSTLSLPPLPYDLVRLHPDTDEGVELDSLRMQTSGMYFLCCVACQALVLAFSAKIQLSSKSSKAKQVSMLDASHDAMYIDKAAQFLGEYITPGASTRTPSALAGGSYHYLAEACNLVAVYCLSLGLWIDRILHGNGKPFTIIVLSPILLLLNRDTFLFQSLTEKRRYFPPYMFGTGFLTVSIIESLVSDLLAFEGGISFDLLEIILNFILTFLCFPLLAAMMEYLWREQPFKGLLPVLAGLLGSMGLFVSSMGSMQTLSGITGASLILLLAQSQQEKRNASRAL